MVVINFLGQKKNYLKSESNIEFVLDIYSKYINYSTVIKNNK